jgi:aldose 1-epimerase
MKVEREELGEVVLYTLSNGGLQCTLSSYGATLTSLKAPDRLGVLEEVTLCSQTREEPKLNTGYFGCIAGRVANRIAQGSFEIDGKRYSLAVNNGVNALHGGKVGFDKQIWSSRAYMDQEGVSVEFRLVSLDGDEGYPGTLTAAVTYTLESGAKQLRVEYKATVEGAATPVNLTNHAYWNLSGECRRPVTQGHRLQLSCSRYLPVDATQIPCGVEQEVVGTLFDFRAGAPGADEDGGVLLGERIPLIDGCGQPGLDHCFCVDRDGEGVTDAGAGESEGDEARLWHMATLSEPESGRRLTLYGTQPGVQVYSANWLSDAAPFTQHNALCLETQHYPDAVNQPAFPSCVLRPGQTYRHGALFCFDTF